MTARSEAITGVYYFIWLITALLAAAVLVNGMADREQTDRIERLERTVQDQQVRIDRQLTELQRLNRTVFDLPEITQGPTEGTGR